ncbi:MAG: ADP-ribosylglycohydrolase family protein [Anaerolineales bacterium]|nr:ADP-ribosylglycohydrolase family protein [Anaerolineales bacterium]
MDTLKRYRGALLGLATADAVGTTLEFQPPGTFTPITDMVGGGPFHLQAGQWTDDTSMALCLADSLVSQQAFDPADQMQRYVRWYEDGYLSSTGTCFDIGNTTRAALQRFSRSGDPYSGATDPFAAGNGSIMRLVPVPMAFAYDAALAMSQSGESSRTTHGAETAVSACHYLGGLLVGALRGIDKATLLSPTYTPAPAFWQTHTLAPEIAAVAAGSFKTLQPPDIKGSGYVVKSLEAALWAFYNSDTFHDGCLLAANLGDDADTTAAVYGQLAGAYYGESAIPQTWRERVALRSQIETFAEKLYALAVSQGGEPSAW